VSVDPTLKILYGPPGTGKTWKAARDAVLLLDPSVTDENITARHREYVESGRIVWVTFHPSYTYEDFVEGLRPVVKDVGVTYEPQPGPFRVACANALAPPLAQKFTVGQVINSSTRNSYQVVHYEPGVVILENIKPGKGEGLRVPVSLWLVEQLVNNGNKPEDVSLPGTEQDRQREIWDPIKIQRDAIFGSPGPLRAVMEYLVDSPSGTGVSSPVVLVIDEINRADTARVFGELVTLLEPDKRLGASEERRVKLPYSGDLFGVPQELHVIGTMNTADRSLTLIDYALRRRFEFELIPPDPSLCATPYAGIDLARILASWNERIEAALDPDHCLGHAYFMESKLEHVREKEGFPLTADGQLQAVAAVIRRNIFPLLAEYFHDEWRMIDFVFGKNWGTRRGGLLTFHSLEKLDEAADELLDLSDVSGYDLPGYWDPRSAGWDAEQFRQSLAPD
jgi:5-methylcytosine-specific restriction enzyme B